MRSLRKSKIQIYPNLLVNSGRFFYICGSFDGDVSSALPSTPHLLLGGVFYLFVVCLIIHYICFMEKETARNVTAAEHSPVGRVQGGTDCSNLDGKGRGAAQLPCDENKVHYECMNESHVLPEIERYTREVGKDFTFPQLVEFMDIDAQCTHRLMLIIANLWDERKIIMKWTDGNYPAYYLNIN